MKDLLRRECPLKEGVIDIINKQVEMEEEFVARRTLELFDVIGEDKLALAMIEERVLKVEYSEG